MAVLIICAMMFGQVAQIFFSSEFQPAQLSAIPNVVEGVGSQPAQALAIPSAAEAVEFRLARVFAIPSAAPATGSQLRQWSGKLYGWTLGDLHSSFERIDRCLKPRHTRRGINQEFCLLRLVTYPNNDIAAEAFCARRANT